MDSLKIVIIGPVYPFRGGIADFNGALYKSLVEAGHQVEVVSFSVQYPSILFPGKSQFSSGPSGFAIQSERLINSVWPFSWITTGRKIAQKKPHLVIIRFWLPFLGPALGSVARVIKFLSPHTVILGLTDNIIPHEKRIGDRILTRYFIKSCEGFVAMSRQVLKDLEIFTKTGCKSFLPHPIYDIFGPEVPKHEARTKLNIPPDQKMILFFGFIRPYKGLDLLLKSLCHIRDVHLLVAGEFYQDQSHYLKMVEELGISNRVHFHNEFIPETEVAKYFCAADLVAQTYKTATQSGVTQIAYHFSRPMLVTNVGGLAEIVDHHRTGYVVDTDPVAIANALSDFYGNNRENEMAAEAKREKKRFSWSAMVEGIENLYYKIETNTCD